MTKGNFILAALILVGFAALITPMWLATSQMSLPASGWGAVIFMIIFCFAVGGGLMFLIFYSARKGYDEEAHFSTGSDREADRHMPGASKDR